MTYQLAASRWASSTEAKPTTRQSNVLLTSCADAVGGLYELHYSFQTYCNAYQPII